jgi:hypothetical protein
MPQKRHGDGEGIEEYIQRISQSFENIPEKVLRQWLYLHTGKLDMIRNYGWIDYHKAAFAEVLWTQNQISQIQVFSKYQPYVKSRSKIQSFSDFRCVPEDKDYWICFGTWRTPIVVLKTNTIITEPRYSELNKPYQLIEGHTRLGHFNALFNYQQKYLSELHKVYLMEIDQ